jgi:surface polysaccharide O-acyltransferase-like enzyme
LLVDVTVYLVWWMCLPYFFLVAGYFFRKSAQAHGDPLAHFRRYASSLVWIFLFWLCVYIIVPSNWPSEVHHRGFWQPFYSEMLKNLSLLTTQDLRMSLTGKPPVWHLWFIPALLVSLAALTGLEKFRLQGYVIPSVIGLYALALGDEVYAGPQTLQGHWSLSILFAALGWWVAGREQPSLSTALSLIVGGYVFALMEGIALRDFFHSSPLAIHDHWYLGGIVLALGIFLLALAKPNLGRSTPLPYLGQFILGV